MKVLGIIIYSLIATWLTLMGMGLIVETLLRPGSFRSGASGGFLLLLIAALLVWRIVVAIRSKKNV